MSNINTFFENAPLHNIIKQNTNEEPDLNDVLIMDDIDDFGQSFSNFNNIKNFNSEKTNGNNNEKSKQATVNRNDEKENTINKPIENIIENRRIKAITTKAIPIINTNTDNFINVRNVNSNIDSLFSNYKNSSLFNSNMNSITNNNLLNAKVEKDTKAAELENKINAINFNEAKTMSKNSSNSNNNNNRNNSQNNKYSNQSLFERNTKLRNNAAINSNNMNSNKELINLLNKPVNNYNFESDKPNKQESNLKLVNINPNNNGNNNGKYEQENIKGFSNFTNNTNNTNNSNNSNNNKRYPDLNSATRQTGTNGIRTLDNNTSINMNSAKNKNLNAYNNSRNTTTLESSYRSNNEISNNIVNSNLNSNYNDHNNLNLNRFSDSQADQVNYDKFKTPTTQRQQPNYKGQEIQFHSVREYALREEMNPKYKNNMEDHVKIIDKFIDNPKMGLFSLYDGHGGEDPVKYVKDRLPEILAKFIKNSNDSIDNCLVSAFEKVDNELKFYDSENTGTTATLAVIHGKNLFLANVGDSRCVLISGGAFEVKRLSYDHKCSDALEIERIKNAGGLIFNNRVFGQLALTRALGDHAIKKYGVIATPYTARMEVKLGDWVVIASDGVWDVTSDEDIKAFVSKGDKCVEIVDSIVHHSLLKGSRDNISCVVIKI